MPLDQTHLCAISEDDEEIFVSSANYGLEGSGDYRAWHILNIDGGDDDDEIPHELYHCLTQIVRLLFSHFYFYVMLLSHFDSWNCENEHLFFWKDVKHPLHLLNLHDLLAFHWLHEDRAYQSVI